MNITSSHGQGIEKNELLKMTLHSANKIVSSLNIKSIMIRNYYIEILFPVF